jgi:hypothetical protein
VRQGKKKEAMKSGTILFLCVVPFILGGPSVLPRDNFNTETNQQETYGYWINSRYSACLKSSLPCDCIGKNEWLVSDFNPGQPLETSFLHITNDFMLVNSQAHKTASGVIYVAETSSPGYEFTYKHSKDTLYVTDRAVRYKFHRIPKYDHFSTMRNALGNFNLNSVRAQCAARKFDMNTKLSINDKAVLFCNFDLEKRNLIHTDRQCNNTWFVKKKKDTILFFRMKNPCADKSRPPVIEEELVFEVPPR